SGTTGANTPRNGTAPPDHSPTVKQKCQWCGSDAYAFARAGDVVLAGDPARLGVVVDGGRAAFVGPRGLIRFPMTCCTTAWRIG
ncbi:DUF6950 family protein, partial [Roseicella frigidaeris]|uniref:DUF6950 family protein n=1 Tax=Roseicella frigidaeris TaxID=2230885 RepID=UPI0038CF8504